MRDAINNKISEGSILLWNIPKEIIEGGNLLCRAIMVRDQNIVGPDRKPLPQLLVIAIDMPVVMGDKPMGRDQEAVLSSFFVLPNPQIQAAVEGMVEGGGVSKLLENGPVPLPRKM